MPGLSNKLRKEAFYRYKVMPVANTCMVHGCSNQRRKHGGVLCPRHYQERWRALNPKQARRAADRDEERRKSNAG